MNDESLGRSFLRQLMMALPWGIVFLIVFFIAAFGIKQEIKEAIQYTAITFDSVDHHALRSYHHQMRMVQPQPAPEMRNK